ncbi:ggdef domain protein [gamma proteobacterium NOR5-3]|nr:ggdef domain protein [gamma proteobacterium NOR5-3]
MPKRDFSNLVENTPSATVDYVSSVLRESCSDIAAIFYQEMLSDSEAAAFLDHNKVESRMFGMFEAWAAEVLQSSAAIQPKELKAIHLKIGETHARVGIPAEQVIHGTQVVKAFCVKALISAWDGQDKHQLDDGVLYVMSLFDTCLSIMNKAYLQRTLEDERNAQALRFRLASVDLSVECERMKTELISWSRDMAYDDWPSNSGKQSSIYASMFGAWLSHKAPLHFGDFPELDRIRGLVAELNGCVERQLSDSFKASDRSGLFADVRRLTDQVCFLIDELAQKSQREMDSRDPLTSLYGRRFLDGILKRENQIAHSAGDAYSLLMIDVDDFKQVNDTYGHAIGDRVLKQVAKVLTHVVRQTDFAFRYGGDELLVVLTSSDIDAARRKADAILQSIRAAPVNLDDGRVIPIKVSIGVAEYRGHPDYETMLKRADEAVYAAKTAGKNQVSSK